MDLIGNKEKFWRVDYGPFLMFFLSIAIGYQLISTIIFVIHAIVIKDSIVRFKAINFGIMEFFFATAIFIELMSIIPIEFNFIAKIFIFMTSFFLYLAVLMPEWATKFFIRSS